jgi:hypothetical protein
MGIVIKSYLTNVTMETQEQNFEQNEELKDANSPGETPEQSTPEVTGDPSEQIKVDNVNTEENIGYANVDDLLGQIDDKDEATENKDVVDNDLNTDDKSMGLDDGTAFLK